MSLAGQCDEKHCDVCVFSSRLWSCWLRNALAALTPTDRLQASYSASSSALPLDFYWKVCLLTSAQFTGGSLRFWAKWDWRRPSSGPLSSFFILSVVQYLSFLLRIFRFRPKFHLACLDTTRSTCRAHAFWLYRAFRTAWLDTLDTPSSTGSTRNLVCCVVCIKL